MRQAELFELIDTCREAGLIIPSEVVDLAGLVIAVKCNPPLNRGGDRGDVLDEDGTGRPPMLMSSLRFSGSRGRRSLGRGSRIRQATDWMCDGLPEPPKRKPN